MSEGMTKAYRNLKQESGVWLEVLSKDPIPGWSAEEIGVNLGLATWLR